MTSLETERARRARGLILHLLCVHHPGVVDIKNLYRLLDDLGCTITYDDYLSHLAYLEEGFYVRKEERNAAGLKIEMYVATRPGLNLHGGLPPGDVGVEVAL